MFGPTISARGRTRPAHTRALPALLGLGLIFAPIGCDRGDHPERLSAPAPLFTITDGAQTIDLAKLRGRVVVLNLWGTWCAPCLEELPSLLDLQRRMPELAVVGVALDQSEDVYRRFLVQHHVQITTVRDADGRINHLYGTALLPETYIIDKTGVLRRKFISAQDWTSPEIMSYLRKLE